MTRVLIADDNPQNRYLLESILKGAGFDVVPAGNGAEALDAARKDPPDLIIADILMPVMDGFELCRRWKADDRLKAIPLLFYTATYTDPKDERFAMSLGADRFVVKPQKPEILLGIVQDLLEGTGNGFPAPAARPPDGEMELLREYNATLFRKLEKKVADLETEIAERRRMEEEILALNRVLEQRVIERTDQLNTALREKEILLREIHHRVKNNLQVIVSLIRLQKNKITDPLTRNALTDSENRVRSMALVHEKLYRSSDISHIDFTDYLRSLTTNLRNTYSADAGRIRLTLDVGRISLDIRRAVPLGLILNELVSNAFKYAFPGDREGGIAVIGALDSGTMVLTVQDDGIGFPDELDWKNTATLGLHLVTSLTDQVAGTIELVRERPGACFVLRVPPLMERENTDSTPGSCC